MPRYQVEDPRAEPGSSGQPSRAPWSMLLLSWQALSYFLPFLHGPSTPPAATLVGLGLRASSGLCYPN